MDQYKKLLSNTLLTAVSQFSSRLLSIFLVSYHTRVFAAAECGQAGLGLMRNIFNIASLLIPIVSLGIANAIVRFGLEKGNSKKHVYTNGLLAILGGFLLLLALMPVLKLIPAMHDQVGEHWLFLGLFVLMSCLRTLNCQFVRARQLMRLYAIDGILCTATNIGFNILFLSGFGWTPEGYLLALICSDACSAIFMFLAAGIWRYIDFAHINTKLLRKMLAFSLPLMPASIFWYFTNTGSSMFITQMLGADVNAVYGSSSTIPSLITVIALLFTEAWQISAYTDGTKAGREHFFSKIFGTYQSVMFMAASGIVWLCRPIMQFYVDPSFYGGWVFIPLLTMAAVFSSLGNFLNSIYMVEKKSGLSLLVNGISAALSLVLNWALIPFVGAQGAAAATLVAYMAGFFLRAVTTRNMIKMNFEPLKMAVNFCILLLESMILITEQPLWGLWCTLLTALMLALNMKSLWDTAMHLFKRKAA